jgi:hypothetical protein
MGEFKALDLQTLLAHFLKVTALPHWLSLYDAMINIEFDASGADPEVTALIEQHVRKATEALRCPHHFPGRVSFQVDEAYIRVVDACCPLLLQVVKDAVGNALA